MSNKNNYERRKMNGIGLTRAYAAFWIALLSNLNILLLVVIYTGYLGQCKEIFLFSEKTWIYLQSTFSFKSVSYNAFLNIQPNWYLFSRILLKYGIDSSCK